MLLGKEDLNKLLTDLADLIEDGEILKFGVCGGGALVYFYDIDYQTTDIDVFNISYGYGSITDKLSKDIASVGKRYDVDSDWLNDAVSLPDFQDKDMFNIKDMKRFLDVDNDIWIYDKNDNPKINLVPVSLCGIIAAKLIAGRSKDYSALRRVFMFNKIENIEDLDRLFDGYPSFKTTDKYASMIENAKQILEG